MFALGYLAGMTTSILVLLGLLYFRPKMERTVNTIGAKLKEKGKILEEEPQGVKDWIESLDHEV